jgi:hypothetical protein
MFSADDIQTRLHERPFKPTRFVTTTGQTYDVFHPELVMVGRRFLIIGFPSTDNPTQAEQVTRVAMIHLTEMQDLPAVATPPTNGPPPPHSS